MILLPHLVYTEGCGGWGRNRERRKEYKLTFHFGYRISVVRRTSSYIKEQVKKSPRPLIGDRALATLTPVRFLGEKDKCIYVLTGSGSSSSATNVYACMPSRPVQSKESLIFMTKMQVSHMWETKFCATDMLCDPLTATTPK